MKTDLDVRSLARARAEQAHGFTNSCGPVGFFDKDMCAVSTPPSIEWVPIDRVVATILRCPISTLSAKLAGSQ